LKERLAVDAETFCERDIRRHLLRAKVRTRALLLSSLLTYLTPNLPAQAQQPQSPDPQQYHIEAVVLAQWKLGAMRLPDKAFTVEQDGRQYPIRVSQPLHPKSASALDYPTHMLLVFPPDTPPLPSANILRSLRATLSHGWLVSITQSDGRFTPYCDSVATLSSALAASAASTLPAQQATWLGRAAVVELENLPGRRVLMFSGKMDDAVGILPGAYISGEPKDDYLIPQVYFVDGGEFKPSPHYSDMTTPHEIRWMSSASDSGSRSDTDGTMQTVYHLGTAHEKTLPRAVKDALHDAHNYYDIQFTVPAPQLPSPGPITLTLHYRTTKQLDAVLYTVSSRTPDSTSIATRKVQPLQVIP
jgi:hypothetical protein